MVKLTLWLRWSWRDLRERWLQVTAIALIIALSTAVYVGMGSTTPWRLQSAEASYDLLNMYDLQVLLTQGNYIERDAAIAAIQSIPHAHWITAVEPRLILPTFVNAQHGDADILVRGRIVGVEVSDGEPQVNGIYVNQGRAFTPDDAGQNVAILDFHFADHYSLPSQGQITLSGGIEIAYVGQGMAPEYFMITSEEGGMWAQANYAVIFMPLTTVQILTHHPDQINDLALTLSDDAEIDTLRDEIDAAFKANFPANGIGFRARDDNSVYRILFQSIRMNQQIYDIIIVLFMAGAMFGAFNLASRIVEAQRRQIGIGMALGLPPQVLVIRPMLVGGQIAILGAVFGVILGFAVDKWAEGWMEGLIPMPVSGDLFQPEIFWEAVSIGLVLPLIATVYPVWRAVRVLPVEAIRTGHLVSKCGGMISFVNAVSIPGKSFVQMPIRNLLRSPRRTILTVLGIGAAITTLVGLSGILDGALLVMERSNAEAIKDHPNRLLVFLDSFYPVDSPQITAITESPALAMTTPAIRIPGTAIYGDTLFTVLIESFDLENDFWMPTLSQGAYQSASGKPGLLISENAAIDLGVDVGDTITLEHPRRLGVFSYETVQTEVEIMGLHPDPWRNFVYMDTSNTDIFGIEGMVNMLHVDPAAGLSTSGAKRAMFEFPTVISVITIYDLLDANQAVLDEATLFLRGVQVGVLVLAFLIAFNSTNINMSERSREIATMFAFGLPARIVTRMAMLENLIVGVFGTLIGFGLGALILVWFTQSRMPEILPEIRFPITVSPATIVLAILVGVLVVALTPLLTIRKMMHMNVPDTLRVME